MNLEFSSIPLAWAAGVLSVLSPCVWPLLPIVMASSAIKGRAGPLFLALGLSLSFALAGGLLTFSLLNAGFSPDAFRRVAATLMLLVGLMLVFKTIGDWVTLKLSLFTSRYDTGKFNPTTSVGQMGVGFLLGFVWLPCVGPTLGAAIALASLGQDMITASVVMFSFGLGTALALIVVALASNKLLQKWQPGVMKNASAIKRVLGWTLFILGLAVLSGVDKWLEILAIRYLPNWILTF